MARLPVRCKKYGVGKEIGGAVYVHRNYIEFLPAIVRDRAEEVAVDFQYHIIKFVEKKSCMSFVRCAGFDTEDEPIVGDVLRVNASGKSRLFSQQADPFIYHHKWLFVLDDYHGFDVEQSRSRSITWLGLSGVDMTRIGRMSFWKAHVLPRIPRRSIVWRSSVDVMRFLGISSCDLCHLREHGSLRAVKLGNAYYYDNDDVKAVRCT